MNLINSFYRMLNDKCIMFWDGFSILLPYSKIGVI